MRPPFHHLRTHRRNSLHGHQERRAARALRAAKDFAGTFEGVRKTSGGHAQAGIDCGRNRKCGAGVHGTRADYDRNRRNDHARAEETGQSRLRAIRIGIYGLQGRAGIHERAEKSAEGSREEIAGGGLGVGSSGQRWWSGVPEWELLVHTPVFSYRSASLRTSEGQTKELQPTELGRVYGRWKAGIPANLSDRYFHRTIWLTITGTPPPVLHRC